MPKLSKQKLEKILHETIPLREPSFKLESYGGRLNGSIISPSFQGRADNERQQMIWDALDESLGPASVTLVGMLLAYTPEEWNGGDKLVITHSERHS